MKNFCAVCWRQRCCLRERLRRFPAADGEESGIVKQVYVKGYKKGDKVLRYAQVIVTQ